MKDFSYYENKKFNRWTIKKLLKQTNSLVSSIFLCECDCGVQQKRKRPSETGYRNISMNKNKDKYIVAVCRQLKYTRKSRLVSSINRAIKIRDKWIEDYENNPDKWIEDTISKNYIKK